MSTLLRIDSSIRAEGSVSRAVADTLQNAWTTAHPEGTVIRRDLVAEPVPGGAWATAVGAGQTPESDRTPAQRAALALAAAAADDLLAADVIVVGSPLYNFNISGLVKTWIDLLLVDRRFAPGTRPLEGRQVVLVIARGGGYGPGTPREGWDHATPYLRRIFADVLGAEVTVVDAELTLADVNPAMEALRPLAAESLARAHAHADETGKALAARVATPA